MITKAVFPVAGLGTRFLPATKANPKEMLPLVDKPLIQFAVEEAIAAGVTELVFVTSSSKRAIEDHFDSHYELEDQLQKRQQYDMLNMVRNIIPDGVSCVYIRQNQALGLGHAVLQTRQVIGQSPFAVILADDLILNQQGPSCLQQMCEVYQKLQSNVLAVEAISAAETSKYGIVRVSDQTTTVMPLSGIVEKPAPAVAPSNLAVIGRYILKPAIFDQLANTLPGAGGEIQLTDAIASLLQTEAVHAYRFQGIRYDCGSKLGYLQATMQIALQHAEVSIAFKDYIKTLVD